MPAEDDSISFRAIVDGQTVACKFSMEALQDIDASLTMAIPSDQFESSKAILLQIAEKKIREGKVENNVVHIFTADL